MIAAAIANLPILIPTPSFGERRVYIKPLRGTGDICNAFPWLRHVFADGAYAGQKLEDALAALGQWTLEIVRRSEFAKGFELVPRRWAVERTIAWLNRNRRLAKDFEASIESALAWVMIASVELMSRRLARA